MSLVESLVSQCQHHCCDADDDVTHRRSTLVARRAHRCVFAIDAKVERHARVFRNCRFAAQPNERETTRVKALPNRIAVSLEFFTPDERTNRLRAAPSNVCTLTRRSDQPTTSARATHDAAEQTQRALVRRRTNKHAYRARARRLAHGGGESITRKPAFVLARFFVRCPNTQLRQHERSLDKSAMNNEAKMRRKARAAVRLSFGACYLCNCPSRRVLCVRARRDRAFRARRSPMLNGQRRASLVVGRRVWRVSRAYWPAWVRAARGGEHAVFAARSRSRSFNSPFALRTKKMRAVSTTWCAKGGVDSRADTCGSEPC